MNSKFTLPIVLCSLAVSAANLTADETPERPHILLIMTDDMGWKDLHCQGNAVLRTPEIDKFAKSGVRFTHAYAASPVCSPTRAALITGLSPARLHITQHGVDKKPFWPKDRTIQPPPTDNSLPHKYDTLAEHLKAAGYATGFFGKWHLGEEAHYPDKHGFNVNIGGCNKGGPPTYFDPYRIPTLENRKKGEYLSDRLADETTSWMKQQDGKPMFICLWTYNPHWPFEAPDELTEHYKGKEGLGLVNPIYGGQIEATDRAIGRVLDELEKRKMMDNTLVIFTSDNGGWSGATDNRPLREGKGHLYEGGIRVPLIIRWPGVTTAHQTDETPVQSMDLTATILDAANVKLGDDISLDGESLRPIFKGEKLKREALYWHYPHWSFHKKNRPGSAIRMGDYKLIHRFDDGSQELYNVVEDIGEKKDLSIENPELTKKLNKQLQAWLNEVKAGMPTKRETD